MITECLSCGKKFDKPNPRKKFCSDTCRKRYARSQAKPESERTPNVTKEQAKAFANSLLGINPDENPQSDALYPYIHKSLVEGNVLASPNGQIALKLAARIDQSQMDTGSAYAALCRELAVRLEAALSVAKAEMTPIDELKAKREQRLSATTHQASTPMGT